MPINVSALLHRAQWRVAAFALVCASVLLTLAGLYTLREYETRSMELVARYHSREAAAAALEDFNTKFSKRDVEHAEWPILKLDGVNSDIVSLVVAGFAQGFDITKSRSDARRLVEQGSVQLRGEKITDPKATPQVATGDVLKLDKIRAVRIA